MAYSYQEERAFVFTEAGQEMLMRVNDRADRLIAQSGVVTLEKLIQGETGSSWSMMACVDRLVEMGRLKEVSYNAPAAQFRIFRKDRG